MGVAIHCLALPRDGAGDGNRTHAMPFAHQALRVRTAYKCEWRASFRDTRGPAGNVRQPGNRAALRPIPSDGLGQGLDHPRLPAPSGRLPTCEHIWRYAQRNRGTGTAGFWSPPWL
jgi:hypothetical protein